VSTTTIGTTAGARAERRVVSTHYRVRRLCYNGEPSELSFDSEAEARQQMQTLTGDGPPGALILIERLDLVADDGSRPTHYEATAIQRELC